MRVRKEKIKISQEAIRQSFIHELLMMGITDVDGVDIRNCDYYTLRNKLCVQRAIME